MIGEEALSGVGTDSSSDDGVWGYTIYMSTRHFDGSNIVFIDGHVKWYRPEQVEVEQFLTGQTGSFCS
jgi:prepilin-type processing-associated H-X9-DG protein